MRILHTADWHLGRRLNRVERLDEQRALMADLVDRTREIDPDAVVVAGDVFDFFTPSAEAERLYYRTLRRLSEGGDRAVLVVAGNHDSSARLAAPRTLLEDLGIIVAGDPHDPDELPDTEAYPGFSIEASGPGWVRLSIGGEEALFHLLPFPSRSRLPPEHQVDGDSATRIVERLQATLPSFEGDTFLVSHLFVGSTRYDVDEDRDDFVGGAYKVDPHVLDRYDAAFLGHLHTQHGTDRWRYAGAPMAFDFDDPTIERGALLWEDGTWRSVPLDGARDLRVEPVPDVQSALERAEALPRSWVRLVFEAGTILSPGERSEIKDAFGDRLVDIQFDVPEVTHQPDQIQAPAGEIDPEAAFRDYYQDEKGAKPPEAIVDLFREAFQEVRS